MGLAGATDQQLQPKSICKKSKINSTKGTSNNKCSWILCPDSSLYLLDMQRYKLLFLFHASACGICDGQQSTNQLTIYMEQSRSSERNIFFPAGQDSP
jgi:Pyruvate/2-oxoacid:ferredoxin oxidoreductase delta subunit